MKICKRCESLNWDNTHVCVACGCDDLANLEGEPTPRSALLLVWASRPQALSNAEAMDAVLKDIYPDILEDDILMAAFHRVLPFIDFNNPSEDLIANVRWTLLNGRRPFPNDVVSDVLIGIEAILSIKRGDVPTYHDLDGFQAEDTNAPKGRRITLDQLQAAAKQGHPAAQFEMGNAYYYGDYDTPADDAKAVYWWRKAAEQGHAEAQYELGNLYLSHDVVNFSPTKAKHWLQLAAEQGYEPAQEELKQL